MRGTFEEHVVGNWINHLSIKLLPKEQKKSFLNTKAFRAPFFPPNRKILSSSDAVAAPPPTPQGPLLLLFVTLNTSKPLAASSASHEAHYGKMDSLAMRDPAILV